MDSQSILEFADNQLQQSENNPIKALNNICVYLKQNIDHYDWVGFYFHHKEKPKLDTKSICRRAYRACGNPFW